MPTTTRLLQMIQTTNPRIWLIHNDREPSEGPSPSPFVGFPNIWGNYRIDLKLRITSPDSKIVRLLSMSIGVWLVSWSLLAKYWFTEQITTENSTIISEEHIQETTVFFEIFFRTWIILYKVRLWFVIYLKIFQTFFRLGNTMFPVTFPFHSNFDVRM